MKKIQILGSGCTKCNKLAQSAKQAADELAIPYEFEKITDILRFADFGVIVTPALVVDGVVKSIGKIPSHEELKKLIA